MQAHNRSLSWFGTGSSIKSDGVKIVLWAHVSTLNDMMRSCTCFPRVSKMPTFIYYTDFSCICIMCFRLYSAVKVCTNYKLHIYIHLEKNIGTLNLKLNNIY